MLEAARSRSLSYPDLCEGHKKHLGKLTQENFLFSSATLSVLSSHYLLFRSYTFGTNGLKRSSFIVRKVFFDFCKLERAVLSALCLPPIAGEESEVAAFDLLSNRDSVSGVPRIDLSQQEFTRGDLVVRAIPGGTRRSTNVGRIRQARA
jgi:hypothetical protein